MMIEGALPFSAKCIKMNGLLNDQPLAELIREISAKRFSGKLLLQHERITVVTYFKPGALMYAASNARIFRLREYLLKQQVVSEEGLNRVSKQRSDIELAAALTSAKVLTAAAAERALTNLVTEVLKLALLWTEGTWEFDPRSHLQNELNLPIDTTSLFLEAGRRISPAFAASRFRNPLEIISPVGISPDSKLLWPEEAFLLSRFDQPTQLKELIALSGLSEADTLRVTYALTLSGLLLREYWKQSFRSISPRKEAADVVAPKAEVSAVDKETTPPEEITKKDISAFISQLTKAKTHYEVLGITHNAPQEEVKSAYYDLARRYHPDRFRRQGDKTFQARIDSAFARITQAYDALSDVVRRSNYDSKLNSQHRADDLAKTAPTATPTSHAAEPSDVSSREDTEAAAPSEAQVAEDQFKQGFAARELGQYSVALGLFSAAARAVPSEPRYRAYYGQVLAKQARTRHLAEIELQAAIKLEPANAEFRVMLAELYRDLGFHLRAKSEAERALTNDPSNRKARELLQSLK
jgi:curved DNA-binding protein CbpA